MVFLERGRQQLITPQQQHILLLQRPVNALQIKQLASQLLQTSPHYLPKLVLIVVVRQYLHYQPIQ